MNLLDVDDRSVACAEFVLGTLTGPDLEAFMATLARDPALQAEVGQWQDRLLPLLESLPPATPTAALWQRIEASLGPAAEPSSTAPASIRPAVTQPLPGPDGDRPGRPSARPTSIPFWQRLGFWQFGSGLAAACALVLAVMLLLRPAPENHYVAVLQTQDGQQAGWVVRASDRGPVRLAALGPPGAIPEGRAWQFWTKGKDAAGPTSLGLVPAGGRLEVPRDRLPDLGEEQLFEITLEPATGSPIGRPTGPILFLGRANRI